MLNGLWAARSNPFEGLVKIWPAFAAMSSDRRKLVLFSFISLKIETVQRFSDSTKCRI